MKKIITPFLVLYFLVSCAQDTTKTVLIEQQIQIVKKEDIAKNEMSLLFIVDIMGHGAQITSAYNPKTATYNYDTVFHYMKPIFESVDFATANLEVTLGAKPYDGYPQFTSLMTLTEFFKLPEIDSVVTSINNLCDLRKRGVEKKIKIHDSLKLKHTGTFYNQAHKDSTTPLIIKKNGIKVDLLNFTYATNGLKPTYPNIVSYRDTITILESIEKAKAANQHKTIAFVHWGLEYKDIQSKDQETDNKLFNDNGVNIIIGSHLHVLQLMKWEKYSVKNTEKLTFYSLGNFFSNEKAHRKDGGAVFELLLTKDSAETKIMKANYILTWVHVLVKNGKKDFLVLPASQYENNLCFFVSSSQHEQIKSIYLT
jgi:poly-gamma-glutamate capsule biosynthesis protein CapA/YwtB (metallophosphatase superfamily)